MSETRTRYAVTSFTVEQLDWTGLYDKGWNGELVPAAFVHPAKVARLLSKRIYDFMFERGWLRENDVVLDPFAGIAGFGLEAMLHGCQFVGVELEQKFVTLGNENIALWNKRYAGKLPRWGTARLLQGDSRKLLDVIIKANAAVSSPPYARSPTTAGNVGNAINEKWGSGQHLGEKEQEGYGASPGQLAAMPEGVISSPPYATGGASEINGVDDTPARRQSTARSRPKAERGYHQNDSVVVSSPPYSAARIGDSNGQENVGHNGNYGASDGQLGAMPEGVVSSPAFGKSDNRGNVDNVTLGMRSNGRRRGGAINHSDYGDSEGQLGQDEGETFWSAARLIVAQCFTALAPGAHAAWVCKDFVRAKQIVPFCDQWRQLCESVGFETVAVARAWQTKDDGTQLATDGNHKRLTKERKGFFRRLHERKYPGTRIDFEQVLFMVKPIVPSP